jgi:hypothetical protein
MASDRDNVRFTPESGHRLRDGHVRFVPIADITCRGERSLLFDVGAGEHRPGNGKTERLGALQVDDKLEFGRLLDRNIGRLRPRKILSANSRTASAYLFNLLAFDDYGTSL